MNKFTFETQGTHTYLAYSVGDEVLDNMSVGMLTRNHIDGFLSTVIMQLDANKFIKYDISAKLSAKEFLSGYVTKKRLLGVFSGVVRALFSAEEYMIDPASVVLDLEYMYSDVATGETRLICLPIINTDKAPVQPANFFKAVISNIQCDPTENCDYFARILNYLNGAAIFSLEDFGELIGALAKEDTGSPAYSSAPAQKPLQTRVQQDQPMKPLVVAPAQPRTAASAQPTPRPVTPPSTLQIPGKSRPETLEQPKADEAASGKKEISWFYLMQHYNAENLAAYKAQKEAKKNKESVTTVPPAPQKPSGLGFAIPGQESPAVTDVASPKVPAQPTPRPVIPQPAQQVPAQPSQTASGGNVSMNFGETVVVDNNSEMNGTVVISAAVSKVKSPCLIRTKTKEKVLLTKPVVRLGRARDFVDYCISDNPAVSQSHANIFNRSGSCFIVDTNSTNHTYVNGIMLSAHAEVQLNEGDIIRLGNEEFEFKFC